MRICIFLGRTPVPFPYIVFGAGGCHVPADIYASSGILGHRASRAAGAFVGGEWRRSAEKSYDFSRAAISTELNEVAECLCATSMTEYFHGGAFQLNLHPLEVAAVPRSRCHYKVK